MTTAHANLGFAAVAALLTVIPGLDTTVVLRSALINGRRHAGATGLGIMTCLLVWGVAAAAGAAALLSASELAYRAVTLVGAGYMVYLGVRMIVGSSAGGLPSPAGTKPPPPPRPCAPSPREPGRTSSTPRSASSTSPHRHIATIPHFIPPQTSTLGMGLTLAGIHALMTLFWFALVITAANAARRFLTHNRALRTIDRITGSIMIGFGIKLVA